MKTIDREPRSHKLQLGRNLLSNFTLFVLNVVIGIWMVPYLINRLGVAGYGLIPLATSLTSYMALVTLSINTAVSRYLTIELQRNDIEKSNKTFNTALFTSLSVILVLIPVIAIFGINISKILNVPVGLERDASLLFLGVMGAFLIAALSANFGVSSFANNRLDLRSLIDITNLLVRTLLIIVLFVALSPRLSYVGLSYLCGSSALCYGSYWVWKRLTPQLRINFKSFDRSQFGDLTSMSGWIIVNQVGTLLYLNIDLIVVNELFGAVSGGMYASVLQWSILLRSMAGILAGALTPIVLIHYAKENKEHIISLSKNAVKFMGMGIALPIGLICGFASPLLLLWLGPEFVEYAPLLCLLTGHLIINLAVLPLFSINTALNKVRTPGLVSLCTGIANAGLALFFPLLLGWGVYGVAAAGLITLTLKNALFTPIYSAHILKIPKYSFVGILFHGLLSTIFIALCAFLVNHYHPIRTWSELIISSGLISIAFLIVTWFVGIKYEERKALLSLIPLKGFNAEP